MTITNQKRIDEQLVDFICKDNQISDRESISINDNLLEDGIIDSLALFAIISFIEDNFNIEVKNEHVISDNFGTIEAMRNYIIRTLRLQERV